MKFSFALLLLAFPFISLARPIYRDSSGHNGNAIKFKPLALFLGDLKVQYERKISRHAAIAGNLGLISGRLSPGGFFTGPGTALLGIDFSPELRYYTSAALKGYYAGAFAQVLNSGAGSGIYKIRYLTVGGGLITGYQWITRRQLVFDLGVSFGAYYMESKDYHGHPAATPYDLEPVVLLPSLNFGIGRRF